MVVAATIFLGLGLAWRNMRLRETPALQSQHIVDCQTQFEIFSISPRTCDPIKLGFKKNYELTPQTNYHFMWTSKHIIIIIIISLNHTY